MANPRDSERREELFELVRIGDLTPNQAEVIAARERLGGPLRHVPAAEEYDPTRIAWWTAPMVLAWIVWRTIDQVRCQYDPYRKAADYWVYRENSVAGISGTQAKTVGGYVLTEQEPASLMGLMIAETFDVALREAAMARLTLTVKDARDGLAAELFLGKLVACAVRCSTQEVIEIPSREWAYLTWNYLGEEDRLCFSHNSFEPQYRLITFSQHEVRKRWPAPKASVRAGRDAADRCYNWLVNEMAKSPEDPCLTKSEAMAYAKKNFGMGRGSFRPTWNRAITEVGATRWSEGGRRPANRADKNRRVK